MEILSRGLVKVEITRGSACGDNCSGCNGCPVKSSVIVAENADNCEVDDMVWLEIDNDKFFYLSFVIFIIPILIMVFSYFIVRNFIKNDDLAATLAFFVGAAVFAALIMLSKKLKTPKCHKKIED